MDNQEQDKEAQATATEAKVGLSDEDLDKVAGGVDQGPTTVATAVSAIAAANDVANKT